MGAWLGEASGYVDTGDGAPHGSGPPLMAGFLLLLRVYVHVENHILFSFVLLCQSLYICEVQKHIDLIIEVFN
jgi:hypothetical protein